MRRPKGELLPNEVRILGTALSLREEVDPTRRLDRFHGFQLLTVLAEQEGGFLMNHTTLYRALRRLEEVGLFESEWEESAEAEAEERGGQRRRYYRLTGAGVSKAREAVRDIATDRRPAWASPLARKLGVT
jgi:PadR family transcriptional regulator, regulatory protein PadR